ncbi:ROK family protein [Pseudactinotalea suaedae]|uniref:ROK family protein n=1 Tax=Pseudactinotalea suaedae TaxID=1524924 RepID=UPI0012E22711|nr:ROK family protein [Pseudactinotalea suaedae]
MSGAERDATAARVLTAVAAAGAATLAQLREPTGLSRQTLTGVLARLRERGWLTDAGPADGGAGRPARRWRIAPRALLVAAVDVGPRAVRVVIAGPCGEALTVRRTPVLDDDDHSHGDGDIWTAAVVSAVRAACADVGIEGEQLAATCVAVPGIVVDGDRVRRSDIIPAITGLALASQIAAGLGSPVVAANDVNLAALGEHRAGVSRTAADVVHVHVGRRSSTALMIDGHVHDGRHGAAGEIGSNPSLYFDPVVELLGAGAAPHDPRFVSTLRAAAEGDPTAVGQVRHLARAVARLVRVLGSFVDPDLVVVSGPAALAGEVLLDAIRAEVDFPADIAPDIVLGELAARATLVGAIAHALRQAAVGDAWLAAVLEARSPQDPLAPEVADAARSADAAVVRSAHLPDPDREPTISEVLA